MSRRTETAPATRRVSPTEGRLALDRKRPTATAPSGPHRREAA